MLTTAVITMSLTPFAMRLRSYGRWRERFPKEAMSTFNLPERGLGDHVVIAGYGRVGSFVARLLARLDQPFVVVDSEPRSGRRSEGLRLPGSLRRRGSRAGARGRRGEAGAAGDRHCARPRGGAPGVERARSINPNVHVVARTTTVEQLEELGRLGVYEAVHPESEAGLELGRQALSHLGVPAGDVQRFADEVRRELYAPITRQGTEGDLLAQLERASRQIETEWVRLPENSPLRGAHDRGSRCAPRPAPR